MQKSTKKPAKKQSKKPETKKKTTTALAVKHPIEKQTVSVELRTMTEQEIIHALDVMGITAQLKNTEQKALFVAIAKEFSLNPYRREIHPVPMDGKLVPVVGYEVYIDRAEATGRLAHWRIEEAGLIDLQNPRNSTYAATIIIKRKDWPTEWKWTVLFREVCRYKTGGGLNHFWHDSPTFMTKKVVIGQGFRLCFREILRGMPFVDAEVEGDTESKTPERNPNDIYTQVEIVETVIDEQKNSFEKCMKALNEITNHAIKPALATMAGKVKNNPDKLNRLTELMQGENRNKLDIVQIAQRELFENNKEEKNG